MTGYERTVPMQADGWPRGISEETKKKLTEAAEVLLKRWQPHGGAELHQYVQDMKYLVPREVWEPPVLWDWQFATVERALRAAGAIPVWRMERDR